MTDDKQRPREAAREWVRATTGILAAFKDAIEETIEDLKERGDLSPDRAKAAMKTTMDRAQRAVEDTRERFDFVARRDFDDLHREVAELRRRVAALEGRGPGGGFPIDEE